MEQSLRPAAVTRFFLGLWFAVHPIGELFDAIFGHRHHWKNSQLKPIWPPLSDLAPVVEAESVHDDLMGDDVNDVVADVEVEEDDGAAAGSATGGAAEGVIVRAPSGSTGAPTGEAPTFQSVPGYPTVTVTAVNQDTVMTIVREVVTSPSWSPPARLDDAAFACHAMLAPWPLELLRGWRLLCQEVSRQGLNWGAPVSALGYGGRDGPLDIAAFGTPWPDLIAEPASRQQAVHALLRTLAHIHGLPMGALKPIFGAAPNQAWCTNHALDAIGMQELYRFEAATGTLTLVTRFHQHLYLGVSWPDCIAADGLPDSFCAALAVVIMNVDVDLAGPCAQGRPPGTALSAREIHVDQKHCLRVATLVRSHFPATAAPSADLRILVEALYSYANGGRRPSRELIAAVDAQCGGRGRLLRRYDELPAHDGRFAITRAPYHHLNPRLTAEVAAIVQQKNERRLACRRPPLSGGTTDKLAELFGRFGGICLQPQADGGLGFAAPELTMQLILVPGVVCTCINFIDARGFPGSSRHLLYFARSLLRPDGWLARLGGAVAAEPRIAAALAADPLAATGSLEEACRRLVLCALEKVEQFLNSYKASKWVYGTGTSANGARFARENLWVFEALAEGFNRELRSLGPLRADGQKLWAARVRVLAQAALTFFLGSKSDRILALRAAEIDARPDGTLWLAGDKSDHAAGLMGQIASLAHEPVWLYQHFARACLVGEHGSEAFFVTTEGEPISKATCWLDLSVLTNDMFGFTLNQTSARLILAVGLARGGPRGVPGLPIKAIAAILGIGERQLTNTILQHPSDYNPLADQKLIAKARHG